MSNKINPIMARFGNEPALLREGSSTWLQSCAEMAAATLAEHDLENLAASSAQFWPGPDDYMARFRPYKVNQGVLTIPVNGILLNGFPYAIENYATGYEYIWEAVRRGMDDAEVKGIIFAIDSGGGMVAGNFDLVDAIYKLRGVKPMQAYTTTGAYSAAYSIASVADRIVMSRSAGLGSIGVVITHTEQSKALENLGISVNIIRSKERKYEGNSLEPLSDAARQSMQDRVNSTHQEFVALVARNRGMAASAVDGTDALCFLPQEAIDKGLGDEIATPVEAFTAFAANTHSKQETTFMTEITEEALANAVETARAEGAAEGAASERARISSILDSEQASTRQSAARMLAFDTDKSPEDVATMLDKLPVEAATGAAEDTAAPVAGAGVGADLFNAAMNGTTNPGINASNDEDQPLSRVQAALTLAKGAA